MDGLAVMLDELYAAITEVVADLDDATAAQATRASAWTVRELLLHQLLDAQRALVALASPTDVTADVDAATYWQPFQPSEGDGGAAHAAYVQRAAAAYASTESVVDQWRSTSAAAARAAAAIDLATRVQTQGQVLSAGDLVSTLVVEATVHLLDLTLELPGRPPAAALEHTRQVLARMLGSPLPTWWDDRVAILKGTGRLPLDDDDRVALGELVPRFPLLG